MRDYENEKTFAARYLNDVYPLDGIASKLPQPLSENGPDTPMCTCGHEENNHWQSKCTDFPCACEKFTPVLKPVEDGVSVSIKLSGDKRIDCKLHGVKYGYCEECAFPKKDRPAEGIATCKCSTVCGMTTYCENCIRKMEAAEPASPVVESKKGCANEEADSSNDLHDVSSEKSGGDTGKLLRNVGDQLQEVRTGVVGTGLASHPTPVVVPEERNFTELIADLTSYAYDDGRTQFSITRGEAIRIARACAELDPVVVPDKHRQARIICDDTGCGEWNCDDCHPETKFRNQLAPVVVSVEETFQKFAEMANFHFSKHFLGKNISDDDAKYSVHTEVLAEEFAKVWLSAHPSPLPEPLVSDEYLARALAETPEEWKTTLAARELLAWRKWGKDSTK